MIKIAFIIVHYRGSLDTTDCIESIQTKSPKSKYEIYLIDNSQDSEMESISHNSDNIHYYKTPENLGFAEGNNLGIKEALLNNASLFVLLNSDTIVSETFFSSLVRFLETEEFSIASPKIYFAPGYEFRKDRYLKTQQGKIIWYAGGKIDWNNIYANHEGVDKVDKGQYEKAKEVDFATGCCMLIKREVVEKIGLFDKNYFLYYEDVDYSLRAKKSGFKILYAPSMSIWHKNALSSGKPGSNLHIYFQARNRLYFGSKYAPLRTKLHLYKQAAHILISGESVRKKAALDFFIHHMGKGSYKI